MGSACSCTAMPTHAWTPSKHSTHIFSCLFQCLGLQCGLCVWACPCLFSCISLSTCHCHVYVIAHCKRCVFGSSTASTMAAQLNSINLSLHPICRKKITHTLNCVNHKLGSRTTLSCSAKYLRYPLSCVLYKTEYGHRMRSKATVCVHLMRKNYRLLSTGCIPPVTVVMVCIIHAWMSLSV